jgi:glutaredoxin-dependent peroxiredoxin
MALKVGEVAPDAVLFKAPRQPIHLSDFKGQPVVLLFFPLAFSSTCTKEMCTIADDYSAWQDIGAQVFGVSVDSPYVNVKFAEECKANFPILSDFNKEATVKYGVYREDLNGLRGVSERAAFVIDGKGVIRYVWVGEHPGVFPPLEEIKDAVVGVGG